MWEAELGIAQNGRSEPDFMSWEVKQYGVRNFNRLGSAIITLMTPAPTDGLYKSRGIDYFVRTYGYPDQKGRPNQLNFGGIHKVEFTNGRTQLIMELIGFDVSAGKIKSSSGRIAPVDGAGNEAAAWSFESLLKHWNRKHNQACYVPSQSKQDGDRHYRYGKQVTLGVETDFEFSWVKWL